MSKRQIHCGRDCISFAFEKDGRIDYRLLYLGVWDSPFKISNDGVSYADNEQKDTMFELVEELFRSPFINWLDLNKSRDNNISRLERQLENMDSKVILIMVDLFFLPYSNFFGKKHFPHVLIVESYKDNDWHCVDPYFSWEGNITSEIMRRAFGCKQYMMGVSLSLNTLQMPEWERVSSVFEKYDQKITNNLAVEVEKFILRLNACDAIGSLKDYHHSWEDLGAIYKRYRGYTYVISYFSQEQNDEDAEVKVTELINKWESFMLSLFRLRLMGKEVDLINMLDKLETIKAIETSIRELLRKAFEQWRVVHDQGTVRTH
ncbi:hypothetical protein D7Z26_13815 [Cohnella endophytica]|uniref:Butirosin biosynthesis protein H N-terminal domain-containing protein n=1 Tax=Cohnella endophytica TaxID=2419778 RepID=A0A494XUW9_9BACL|nr:DUF6005 family protein [Cohnella endophytica]RKP54423.1 hypothetical protein D7Z26_13815 [Cohnella endophytica]